MTNEALAYHEKGRPGKLAIRPTKSLANQRDLALAYSPGVADACSAIVEHQPDVSRYTARGNLVAVISNGSAVLGLGDIGALASKPVMEGKAVLFKSFADIDCFDIEVDESDPSELVKTIQRIAPTFGAINLEDIKAPECFEVEEKLSAALDIPVFHDDQHGTAIVVAAAIKNALRLAKKDLQDCKIVSTGGGAAGIACLNLLCEMGAKRSSVWLFDKDGLVTTSRDVDAKKARFARQDSDQGLGAALEDADIFLGLSAAGILKASFVAKMASDPVILALANPEPEIRPEEAMRVRPDAIVATGRTDYPNQVNNVLCFPFIFRGALDVGASQINEEMKIACVDAIANLAHQGVSDEVVHAYGVQNLSFGRDYLLPKPFDSRLLVTVAPAVAKAAMASGVAKKPISDIESYVRGLTRISDTASSLFHPVLSRAKSEPKRIVFVEGTDPRVMRATTDILKEGIAQPVLTGAAEAIEEAISALGLDWRIDDIDVLDTNDDRVLAAYAKRAHSLQARYGLKPEMARDLVKHDRTVLSALHVELGHADSLICGTDGAFQKHLTRVRQILDGKHADRTVASLVPILHGRRTVFVADGYVNADPTAEVIADICESAAETVRGFGFQPRVALIGHSSFGAFQTTTSNRMRDATLLLTERGVDFEFEGEMRLNLAFDTEARKDALPCGRLTDDANILVFPNMDAANATINAMRSLAEAETVGPLLLGYGGTAHIVTPSIGARGLFNMAAIAGH